MMACFVNRMNTGVYERATMTLPLLYHRLFFLRGGCYKRFVSTSCHQILTCYDRKVIANKLTKDERSAWEIFIPDRPELISGHTFDTLQTTRVPAALFIGFDRNSDLYTTFLRVFYLDVNSFSNFVKKFNALF